MTEFFQSLAGDPVVTGLVTSLVVLTLADFVVAIGGAIKTSTFSLAFTALFVQTHIMGRVLPIIAIIILGHWEPPLAVLAATAASAYALETIGSIRDTVILTKSGQIQPISQSRMNSAVPPPADNT
jgi:ABC-type uncharacterized transport system permease subunit